MARRTKRVRLDKVILGAAKTIRKNKLEFEREASRVLSDALGFLVTVKIQKQQPAAANHSATLAMRRAKRKTPAEVSALINGQLAEMELDELPDFQI